MDDPLFYLIAPFDHVYLLCARYMAYIMETNEEKRVKVFFMCLVCCDIIYGLIFNQFKWYAFFPFIYALELKLAYLSMLCNLTSG